MWRSKSPNKIFVSWTACADVQSITTDNAAPRAQTSLLALLRKPNWKGQKSNELNAEIARMLIAAGADVNENASPDP